MKAILIRSSLSPLTVSFLLETTTMMSQSKKTPSNSSGKCMHCNVFFHQLAAHMLSSETCMLASQESLSNKRVCNEYDVEPISANSCICNLHTESVTKKLYSCNFDFASISNIEQSFASCPKLLQYTSAENIYGDDEAFINCSSDDVSFCAS